MNARIAICAENGMDSELEKYRFFQPMHFLPYHHDWKLAFQSEIGLRLHWFGRYAGYADWNIPEARLAADMVSFFFVEKNSCWAIVNGRKWVLKKGDLLVVCGADEFSYGHDFANPHVSLSASLAVQQGSVANTLLQRKFQRRYSWSKPDKYVVEFEKVLAALASTSPHRDFAIAGALLQWLSYVMTEMNAPLALSDTSNRDIVDKVLAAEAWANARLKGTITLAEWAKALKLNPVYFGRIFRRETGLRPMEWLNERRLQMACQYLSGTNKSVADIAESCGFTNQFYFSRVFRRHFGQPPLQYRKARF